MERNYVTVTVYNANNPKANFKNVILTLNTIVGL